MDPIAEVFFNYLHDAIYSPAKAVLDWEKLPPGFRDFAKGLVYYTSCVQEVRDMARALSKGDLSGSTPSSGNELAAPLKSLCASLRHLTWQTQQVAHGDYTQQVNFMGEFAAGFNVMVEQLALRQKALLEEIAHGNRKMLALAQSKSLFEAIAEQVTQWVIVTDKDGEVWHYANHPVGEMLPHTDFETRLREWLKSQAAEAEPLPCNEELDLRDDAVEQCFRVAIHPLQWQEQEARAFILTDISVGRARLKKLETIAYHDPLTKTYSRHYGLDLLADWLEKRQKFILCFVDMDNLKYVNDNFGHNEGDVYILSVTETLRRFSDAAIVCRLGGDEFMLLAADWTEEMAVQRMEDLRDSLSVSGLESEHAYRHSISYGLVEVDENNRLESSELLSLADEKMYTYKRVHKPVAPFLPHSVNSSEYATKTL
ncbi:MAG: diguanylate cyclase [Acidobacteriota bacterium]|jgi:diguanylate cyclase (GGDEF)-like protein|nr:diguanylate cyclase [Acidobacteriota bacterium]